MMAACTTAVLAGGLALVGVAAPASATGGAGAAGEGHGEGHTPVTLCHAITPDSASAGWNELTVDDDAIVHAGHTEHSADIIPAFEGFDGLNLTESFDGATGQEILDNGCVAPEPEPTEPTLVTPAAPSANDECGTENDGIVVPADGIGYSYDSSNNAGSTTVTVVAATGYVFPAETKTEWTFELSDEACEVESTVVVVVSSATFVDPCGPDNDVLTLPTGEGVAYTETEHTDSVSGATVRVVTATAVDGYVLSLDGQEVATGSWEFVVNDAACEVIVPTPEVPAEVPADVTTPVVPTVVAPSAPAGVLSADTSVVAPVVAPVTPVDVRTDSTLADTGFNGAELGQLAALLLMLGVGTAGLNAYRSSRRSPAVARVRR